MKNEQQNKNKICVTKQRFDKRATKVNCEQFFNVYKTTEKLKLKLFTTRQRSIETTT